MILCGSKDLSAGASEHNAFEPVLSFPSDTDVVVVAVVAHGVNWFLITLAVSSDRSLPSSWTGAKVSLLSLPKI